MSTRTMIVTVGTIIGFAIWLAWMLGIKAPEIPEQQAAAPPMTAAELPKVPSVERLAALRMSGGENGAIAWYENRRMTTFGRFKKTMPFEGYPLLLLYAASEMDFACLLTSGKDRAAVAKLKRGDIVYVTGENLDAGPHTLAFKNGCRMATPEEIAAK